MLVDAVAAISLIVWAYLLCARGFFWLGGVRDDKASPPPAVWPPVAAIVPARNEAPHIGASLASLLKQDYPGPLTIVTVDDDSSDGTGEIARQMATQAPPGRAVKVVAGAKLPAGWTGKLWAVRQGIAAVEAQRVQPDFVLLTDADIVHAPDSVSWLVAHALQGGYVLSSFMAKLRCKSLAERMHVPAFIFFFQMLYPFRWVRRRDNGTAAAAGGCMLVSASALRAAGGIESVRNALIDDCALAERMKKQGPIWLGLTERVLSLRPYDTFDEVKRMIARSAYAQLKFSPWLLAGTILGLALVYLAPPLCALLASGWARWLGLAAWLAMAFAFQPTLRFYRLSPLWGVALPGIALLYMYYTFESAYRHWRRRGGEWKGRVHVNATSA